MIKHKIILRKKLPIKSPDLIVTQTTTTPCKHYDLEELFAETLNVLFEGMARGNQIDKRSAEALIKSIKYKTQPDFYNECLSTYDEALRMHEAVFSETVVNKITRNISELVDRGVAEIKKITQQIILSPPNDETN